ncbi:16S rRNA (cytosine(967)-C(5))-methyltransferase RsmB [Neptunicella sp. SCSIO 80796]|uniref:16S rRNA (cytosine(967)-C(5))-methyltransferase RsmB n=1 Tax=Neptunicella plasticusilytica TaxID=3117012 RepID=UPI003A4D3708
MKKPNLRADAANILLSVLEKGQSLRDTLPAAQEKHQDKDKAWLQEMVFGVLRQLPLLQYWLRQLLDKPLKGRNKVAEHLIVLGLYQLAFSRVSDHAAVSETVAACPTLKVPGLKGLVNAILRNFVRQKLATKKPENAQILSGLPNWLFQQISQHYPEQSEQLIHSMHNKAPIWLRVNQQQCSVKQYCAELEQQQIAYQISEQHPDGLILQRSCDITSLPGYDKGWFAVQDGAAQLAARLLSPQQGESILDACAAPGGKTCHILELQPGLKRCLALDVDQQRLLRVAENLHRLGHNADLVTGDASDTNSWWDGVPFDRILLDAPCSATGVIRRHPDIKWLRKASDINELVALQAKIMDALWPTLKSGGHMLYATCSILPQENGQQIGAFLSRHQDASVQKIPQGNVNNHPGRQILPGEQQMDGFYYCMLLKS